MMRVRRQIIYKEQLIFLYFMQGYKTVGHS